MSLRGIDGARVLDGGDRQSDGRVAPAVLADVDRAGPAWFGVRQVQQALHAARYVRFQAAPDSGSFGPLPSLLNPGPVDGQWGRRTQNSLAALIRAFPVAIQRSEYTINPELASGEAEDRLELDYPLDIVIYRLSQSYRSSMSALVRLPDPPPSTTSPLPTVATDPPPTGDSPIVTDDEPPPVLAPVARGWPWWAWLLLSAAAVGVGYGAWRYYKSRRGSV